MTYSVKCPDGVIHEGFPTRSAAIYWADWGHFCMSLSHHEISEEFHEVEPQSTAATSCT